MSERRRRVALLCLYGLGATTTILILLPLLGVWLAVPAGATAFGLFLSMPYYSARK